MRGVLVSLLLVTLGCGRIGYDPQDEPVTAMSRIDGEHWLGANLPWREFGYDFGDVDWGASTPAAQAELEPVFESAASGGLRVVRWIMFAWSDSVPFTIGGDGLVDGFTPEVQADLDAAIGLAARHDLYLSLVLFAGDAPGAAYVADPAQREAIASAVGALIASADRVASWAYWPSEAFDANARAFAAALAASIHAAGGRYNVLAPGVDRLAEACETGADYVGFRDFGEEPNCPGCTSYSEIMRTYAPSCPISLDVVFAAPGEMPRETLDDFYRRGYAGSIAWSLLPAATADQVEIDLAATEAFSRAYSDIGPR